MLSDPLERLLEDFFGVRFEDNALAWPPTAGIHLILKALGKFLLVEMRVELGAEVDVALGTAKRAEVLADIFRIWVAGEHGGHHEGGVDDLAEAELLHEIVGTAEQRRSGDFAIH